jgi:hypothetical protein
MLQFFSEYIILELVPDGGWTQIRLCRITRSSTCVCLRIRNFVFPPCYARSARWRTPTPITCAHDPMGFCTNLGFNRFNAHPRSPTPITSAHCSNECVYQFGTQSVQPCGSLCSMCTAMRTFVRAERTSMRTRKRRPL